MPDGEEIDYEISPKPVSDASGSYVVWLPPTRLTMAVSAEEYEAYTEEITVEYGKEQKKDIELEKKLRSIYGAVVGTSHSDDMWYATVYVLDKADHLILTDTGSFAAFVFHDDFSGGVYATVDFGSVTIWKANDRSIIVKLYYSYGDRTIVSVYSLDEKNHLVQDPDIQVEDPDQHYYEQLFYSRLEYHQLLTREEVQKKYYVPKETVKTDRAIDDLLKDINHVFPDPELKSTSLKKDENDAVIAYTESYTKNGITLQIEALTDGTIVSVRIDDSKQYSTRDYTYKATDAFFTAGSEMRALYDAVIRSEALSMKGNRDQLAAFDFDRYQVSERVSNGTHLGFELGGSLTNGNVTVTYRKSTHEIASTSFTSFVEIQIGE